MLDFGSIIDVADKLGVIQAVKAKLLRQPDPAADKLVAALEEIYKIYASIEAELPQFLALTFDASDPAELAKERARLLALEGGEVTARMGKLRGHCSKIGNIYSRYLSPWFSSILSSSETAMLSELFLSLDEFDGQMIGAVDKLANWLTTESATLLTLVDSGDVSHANERVREARKEVLPARLTISGAMRTLLELQAEFVSVSGAV